MQLHPLVLMGLIFAGLPNSTYKYKYYLQKTKFPVKKRACLLIIG